MFFLMRRTKLHLKNDLYLHIHIYAVPNENIFQTYYLYVKKINCVRTICKVSDSPVYKLKKKK